MDPLTIYGLLHKLIPIKLAHFHFIIQDNIYSVYHTPVGHLLFSVYALTCKYTFLEEHTTYGVWQKKKKSYIISAYFAAYTIPAKS